MPFVQKLGEVPEAEFEAAIAERRVEQLTAKPEKLEPIEPVDANVLWLWGVGILAPARDGVGKLPMRV